MIRLSQNWKQVVVLMLTLSVAILLAACDSGSSESIEIVRDGDQVFANAALDVKYTGTESCQPCHEEINAAFMNSPKGRSLSVMSSDNLIEVFPQKEAVYESSRNFYYEMIRKGDKFYQREFRLDADGEIIHERLMEAQYIIGSGTNLRMYFYDENGMFYQLPLTWYVHEQRWDMSPGYREFTNVRFSRYVTSMCMSCHNGHTETSPIADNRYVEPYSIGIGCEDCHGPGELHIKQEEGKEVKLPTENALTIVNPVRLSPQRQIDICQQCHLEGVARALNENRGWFDFRPGMSLSNHRSVYSPSNAEKRAFKVANTAYRLAQSRCFESSHAAMTCTLCHDSHGMLQTSNVEFNRQNCQKCHPPQSLPGKTSKFAHSATDDCIPCHMKQTGKGNTLHGVVNHDHWIRSDAKEDTIDWTDLRHFSRERKPFRLVADVAATNDKEDMRKGAAYAAMYWEEHETRVTYLDSALFYLNRALQRDSTSASAYYYLGRALFYHQRLGGARASLQRAIDLRPNHAPSYFYLGNALLASEQLDGAIQSYERAVELKPGEPTYREKLGSTLARAGRTEEAIAALEGSLRIDKQNPVAYYTLGNLYVFERKEPQQALEYFKQAVALDPDLPNGYLNLGNTYAMLGELNEATAIYKKEIATRARSLKAYINLGRVYEEQGEKDQAMQVYENALAIDPLSKSVRRAIRTLAKK
jgi:tetratricopeptide (TPR) repeat protein